MTVPALESDSELTNTRTLMLQLVTPPQPPGFILLRLIYRDREFCKCTTTAVIVLHACVFPAHMHTTHLHNIVQILISANVGLKKHMHIKKKPLGLLGRHLEMWCDKILNFARSQLNYPWIPCLCPVTTWKTKKQHSLAENICKFDDKKIRVSRLNRPS